MRERPTYEDLEQRIKALEEAAAEARRAQESCGSREDKFVESFLKSPIPMAITAKKDGRYVDVNEAFVKIMGLKQEELLNNTSVSAGFITADQRALFLNEYDKKGSVTNLELQMRVKGGELWYGLFNSSKINISGEEYFLTAVTDITDRKKLEEAKKESDQKLYHLADNLSNAVVYQAIIEPGAGTRFTYVSRAVERLNELTEDEVLVDAGAVYRQMLPEYRTMVKEREEEALKNLTALRVEVQSRLPSGRLRWFEYVATPRYGADGILLWDGVQIDITDRKRTEESSLMKERDLSDTIIGSLPGLFFIIDEEYRFLRWNDNFMRTTGNSAEEMQSIRVLDLHPESGRRKAEERIKQGFVSGYFHNEEKVILKNGTFRTWLITARKMQYMNRLCLIGMAIDMTDKRKAEEDLNRFAENLEDANIALRVLMNRRNEDQKEADERLQVNINDLVVPYLKKLKTSKLDDRCKNYVNVLESNLADVLSPFMKNLLSSHKNLTPQEIYIVDLIAKGRNTKEIADMLNASVNTIATHRNNIRKKLNLRNSKVNLRTHVLSIK